MRKLALILTFIASNATASDIVEFKNGMTFNHKGHQTDKIGMCSVCHENAAVSEDGKKLAATESGKIKGFGKEWAHKYCKDCHEVFSEGPVTCNDCHQKKM